MYLKSVIYVSKGQGDLSLEHLRDLFPRAWAANDRSGITGVLVYDGAYYLQIVEGARIAVDRLMARIAMDTRHSQMRFVVEDRSSVRRTTTFSAGVVSRHAAAFTIPQLMSGEAVPYDEVRNVCFAIASKAKNFE
ncbi:MAG: BLUF domain-containing protein [Alcaligenaceae bacterium]|nr:MAG: BLUF domain-containing protein [Alcaligenaceae bacterium]